MTGKMEKTVDADFCAGRRRRRVPSESGEIERTTGRMTERTTEEEGETRGEMTDAMTETTGGTSGEYVSQGGHEIEMKCENRLVRVFFGHAGSAVR